MRRADRLFRLVQLLRRRRRAVTATQLAERLEVEGTLTDARKALDDTDAKIRFVPDADYNGPAGDLTFRAWDQSDGNPNGMAGVDTTLNGGATAFSTATDVAAITVTAVNDPSVLAAIEGAPLAYTENDAATVITSTLTVSDVDDTNIEGATIQITGNYQNGQDVLAFADTANISGSWDAGSGTLTLSGTDTLANYQAALRAVTYQNTSDDPSTLASSLTHR